MLKTAINSSRESSASILSNLFFLWYALTTDIVARAKFWGRRAPLIARVSRRYGLRQLSINISVELRSKRPRFFSCIESFERKKSGNLPRCTRRYPDCNLAKNQKLQFDPPKNMNGVEITEELATNMLRKLFTEHMEANNMCSDVYFAQVERIIARVHQIWQNMDDDRRMRLVHSIMNKRSEIKSEAFLQKAMEQLQF